MTSISELFSLFLYLTCVAKVCLAGNTNYTNVNYAIVIDAGSTGTRGFVFRYLHEFLDGEKALESYQARKVKPGLSTFASNPEEAAEYLMPVLIDAASYIPEEYQSRAPLYIKGTAGMRLLTEEEQKGIWDALYSGLNEHPDFKFKLKRSHLGTIDGHSEAYYAVMSSNYIAGTIDASLLPTPESPMINALDMGGASTQMVLYTGQFDPDVPLRQSDFWSHSWLNFGVDRMRERTHEFLVDSQRDQPVDEETGLTYAIDNPCSFVGHIVEIDGRGLLGSGNGAKCVALIKEIMWPHGSSYDCESSSACSIDGIVHPPVSGEFYAMSVYFYALDCIRHFTDLSDKWPTPTINEIYDATFSFCSQNWTYMNEHGRENKHKYTSHKQLPNRCLEGLYIATLLRDGFGFDGDSRDIHMALTVKGMEVEWTQGFALVEVVFPPPYPEHEDHIEDELHFTNDSESVLEETTEPLDMEVSSSGDATSDIDSEESTEDLEPIEQIESEAEAEAEGEEEPELEEVTSTEVEEESEPEEIMSEVRNQTI